MKPFYGSFGHLFASLLVYALLFFGVFAGFKEVDFFGIAATDPTWVTNITVFVSWYLVIATCLTINKDPLGTVAPMPKWFSLPYMLMSFVLMVEFAGHGYFLLAAAWFVRVAIITRHTTNKDKAAEIYAFAQFEAEQEAAEEAEMDARAAKVHQEMAENFYAQLEHFRRVNGLLTGSEGNYPMGIRAEDKFA